VLTDDGAHLRLYQDGQLVATATAPPMTAAHGELSIGCDKLFESHFKGRIDEVRIYNPALGGAEVAADMEAPIQTPKMQKVTSAH
jgi:Concanavalin A-like lectin/glucanases superfamily